jgi:hypothetical protein
MPGVSAVAGLMIGGALTSMTANYAASSSSPSFGIGGTTTKFDFGNSTFDLSPLMLTSGYYRVMDSRNNLASANYSYFLNFGANIPAQNLPGMAAIACNTTVPGTGYSSPKDWDPAPAYQYANPSINAPPADQCHRLGDSVSPASMTWGLYDQTNPSRGVTIQYKGGDRCPGTSYSRSMRIWLLCYDDATNIPDEEMVLESGNPVCTYDIFIRSAFGCPTQCALPMGPSGNRQLCAGHGVCDFDASKGTSRCFCNPGYTGDDCSQVSAPASKGLSAAGGVLIAVSVILAMTLAFL